ncbi:MAG: hypothetical protein J6B88_01110 [Clostridia bacterium]|nr:hypothetical protein [Clostridia bacterium]
MSIIKCKIADFNLAIETDIKTFSKIMQNYLADFKKEDVVIKISDNDIALERAMMESDLEVKYETTYKLSAIHRKIGDWLPSNNSFVLHSACFDVDGVGVAFAAHSGTGKTTHMNLWQQLLGDKMTVVNGDKPIVRFFDGEPNIAYAYGSPWMGKERLGGNMRTKLKHICFIERSETNYVTKMNKSSVTERLIKQVYMPKDPVALINTMALVDRLLSCCDFWIIHCNMEPEAAEVAYNTIINGNTSVETSIHDCSN